MVKYELPNHALLAVVVSSDILDSPMVSGVTAVCLPNHSFYGVHHHQPQQLAMYCIQILQLNIATNMIHYNPIWYIFIMIYTKFLHNVMAWMGLWGFLWWAPSAKRKDHHGVSSGWNSTWFYSNTGLSSTQYEQIPIIYTLKYLIPKWDLFRCSVHFISWTWSCLIFRWTSRNYHCQFFSQDYQLYFHKLITWYLYFSKYQNGLLCLRCVKWICTKTMLPLSCTPISH